MEYRRQPKIRSEETWHEIRRAWERGETGASVALRYEVGLSNLWRRRASEGWRRLRTGEEPPVEPVEGWARPARRQREAFDARLAATRELAECLMQAAQDERLMRAPTFHIPWLYHWRADHLGPEAAARDRARAREAGHAWAEVFWRDDGTLRPLETLDEEMARLEPEELREALGLPPGVEIEPGMG
jgi:hypothetical protein